MPLVIRHDATQVRAIERLGLCRRPLHRTLELPLARSIDFEPAGVGLRPGNRLVGIDEHLLSGNVEAGPERVEEKAERLFEHGDRAAVPPLMGIHPSDRSEAFWEGSTLERAQGAQSEGVPRQGPLWVSTCSVVLVGSAPCIWTGLGWGSSSWSPSS